MKENKFKLLIHGYKYLFARLKISKRIRKKYKIKPYISFVSHFPNHFFILPTILVMPWIYRYPDSCIIEILWFNFSICIGKWIVVNDEKGESEC